MTTAWLARLFRIELERNATWALLPRLAGLLWIASPYGRALRAPVVLWSSRSVAMQGTLHAWLAARLVALRAGQAPALP